MEILDKIFGEQKNNSIVIYPPHEGGVVLQDVYQAEKIPGVSLWEFQGGNYFLLYKPNGRLEAYNPPDEIKLSPDKVFRSLHWDVAKRVFAHRRSLMDKINAGLSIALVGILGFILFLIISA